MLGIVKNNKKILVVALISLIIGVGVGRYATPEKVEVRYEKVEIEKIVTVEKKIYVKQEVKKTSKKKKTKSTKITKPDGTVIESTIEEEEDVAFADTREKEGSETSESNESSTRTNKTKETKYDTKRLRVSALVGVTSSSYMLSDPFDEYNVIYGVHASYKFFGPISVGVFGLTSNTIGLSLGFDF